MCLLLSWMSRQQAYKYSRFARACNTQTSLVWETAFYLFRPKICIILTPTPLMMQDIYWLDKRKITSVPESIVTS